MLVYESKKLQINLLKFNVVSTDNVDDSNPEFTRFWGCYSVPKFFKLMSIFKFTN